MTNKRGLFTRLFCRRRTDPELEHYLLTHYEEEQKQAAAQPPAARPAPMPKGVLYSAPPAQEPLCRTCPAETLEDRLRHLDESFSQAVLRLIDEKGITDAMCYNRAGIDRRHFAKMRSDIHYRPSKRTAVALAVALELTPEETGALLEKAGFALSRSSKFDVIVEFFLSQGIYDVFTINEALYAYDQPTLG